MSFEEPGPVDVELAQLERRWTLAALVIVLLALFGAAAALLMVPLVEQPLDGVHPGDGWPPFNHPYNSLESLVAYWWPIAVPVLVVIGLVAIRLFHLPTALLIVGIGLLIVALALGLRPIRSYPEHKQTPGAGDCNAIFGSGPYGDNDEVCFDVRAARRYDTAVVGALGFMTLGLGIVIHVGGDWSRKREGDTDT